MKPSFTLKGKLAHYLTLNSFFKTFTAILFTLLLSAADTSAQVVFKLKADNTITTVNLDDYTNPTEQAKWERTDDGSFVPPASSDFLNAGTTFIIDHQLPMSQIDITCNDGAMTARLELFAYAKALNLNSDNGVNFSRLSIQGNLSYNTNITLNGTSNIDRLTISSASFFYMTNGATISINELLDQNRGNISLINGEIVIKNGAQYTFSSGILEFLNPTCHITGEGTASFSSYDGLGTAPIIKFTNPNGLENGPGNHFQFDNIANIQLPDATLLGNYYFLGGYGNATTGSLMPATIDYFVTSALTDNSIALTNDLQINELVLYSAIMLGNKNLTLVNKDILNVFSFGSGIAANYEKRMIATNGTGALTILNFTGTATFPVAHTTNLGANYSPVVINNTSGIPESFTVRVQDAIQFPYDDGQYKAATLTWFITEGTIGGTTADISFQWNKTEEELAFDIITAQAAHYNGIGVDLFAGSSTDPDGFVHTYAITGITSFSPWSILSPFSILPINLISFDAAIINKDEAKLSWSTASESNNDRFEIERSTNGNNFTKIGELKGKGNSSTRTDYSATTSIKGLTGVVYYRLKQIDMNGKATYSPIKTIKIASANFISVGPNPFIDQVKINTDSESNGKISIKIINSNGNALIDKSFDAKKGRNEFKINNLGNLSAGMYIIKVIGVDGNVSNTYKIIK